MTPYRYQIANIASIIFFTLMTFSRFASALDASPSSDMNTNEPELNNSYADADQEVGVSRVYIDQYGKREIQNKRRSQKYDRGINRVKLGSHSNKRHGVQLSVSAPSVEQANYSEAEEIHFSAIAKDKSNNDFSDLIVWESSVDGRLGEGAEVSLYLSAGTHTITASIATHKNNVFWSQEIYVDQDNTPPTVNIISPIDGSSSYQTSLVFALSALDVEDGVANETVVWSSNIDGVLSDESDLSVGQHILTVSVTDSGGLTSSDSVEVEVLAPLRPIVRIDSPLDGDTYIRGEFIHYETTNGVFAGIEIVDETLTSSIDGEINDLNNLSVGLHTITAMVTDSQGLSSADDITVEILDAATNTRPMVEVSTSSEAYLRGSSFYIGIDISDAEDGYAAIRNSLVWSSNIDGVYDSLGNLSLGNHVITATVTDSSGLVASDSFNLYVHDAFDVSSVVSIDYPNEGDTFFQGDFIPYIYNFENIDGWIITSSELSSSIDGVVSNLNSLSVGVHELTLSVSYRSNAAEVDVSDTVTIEILDNTEQTPPYVNISSPSDGDTVYNNGAYVFDYEYAAYNGAEIVDHEIVSDIDGVISNIGNLSVGPHILTLTALDSNGLSASHTIAIDVVDVPEQVPPTVQIQYPSDGDVFVEGAEIHSEFVTYTANGADIVERVLTSNIDGVIDDLGALSVGSHTITMTVTDSNGFSSFDSITIEIIETANTPPTVSFVQVANSYSAYFVGEQFSIPFYALDLEDGLISDNIVLSSSIDGIFTNWSLLSAGEHAITASAADSGGAVGMSTIELRILELDDNTPPTLEISGLGDGQTITQGEFIYVSVFPVDAEDSNPRGELIYSSDIDGIIYSSDLGEWPSISLVDLSNLSVGQHVITATATDRLGLEGSHSITVNVVEEALADTGSP